MSQQYWGCGGWEEKKGRVENQVRDMVGGPSPEEIWNMQKV